MYLELKMNAKKVEAVSLDNQIEEEFSIPLCIDDIISICKEYSSLGSNIQRYMDAILEDGLEQSIKSGKINKQYIPHIRSFLTAIKSNPLFGEAGHMAADVIGLIDAHDRTQKSNVISLFVN